MHFYCNNCDKEVKANPKNHRISGKLVQTHTIKNPKVLDMNRIFYDHAIIHKKNMNFLLMNLFFKKNLKL